MGCGVDGLLGCLVVGLLGWLGCWVVGLVGCLVVWLFGCLVVWLFGCLVVWLFGCLVVWLFGCLQVTQRRAREVHRRYKGFYSSHLQTGLVHLPTFAGLQALPGCCPAVAASLQMSEVTHICFVVALVNATSSSSPSVSAVTVRCLLLFGQVVQHQSDRDPFVTFEVCSHLVSVPLQFLLQLPHPVTLAFRVLFEFLELVVDVGPDRVSHCSVQPRLEMLETSTEGVASVSCVPACSPCLPCPAEYELRLKLLSFHLEVCKPRHA